MIRSRMFSGLSLSATVTPKEFFIALRYPPIRPLGVKAITLCRLAGRFSRSTSAFAASSRYECIVLNLLWSCSTLVPKKPSISSSRSKKGTSRSSDNSLPTVVFPTHPTPVKNIRTYIFPTFSDSEQVII